MFRPAHLVNLPVARADAGVRASEPDTHRRGRVARATLRLDRQARIARLARHYRAPCFAMRDGDLLRVDHREALRITVRSGGAWLTRPGDREDHYLGSGQFFDLDRRGGTLVQALKRTVLEVTWARESMPERMTLIRAGKPIRVLAPGRDEQAWNAARRTAFRMLNLLARAIAGPAGAARGSS
jgi:hypothetical protein